MKLYAKVSSERATKGQGGNSHIETNYFVTDKEQPQFRTRIINDEPMGLIYVSFEQFFFGKWRVKYQTKLFINVDVEQKGEKKKDDFQSNSNGQHKGCGGRLKYGINNGSYTYECEHHGSIYKSEVEPKQ